MPPVLRIAEVEDATCLSDLAIRSKAFWGYSTEFMQACTSELTVSPDDLNAVDRLYVVEEIGAQIVGFYCVRALSKDAAELDALFVDPGHIGTGVGKNLMVHCLRALKERATQLLRIHSDPHATSFYQAFGAVKTGDVASGSIPGRVLPQLELKIE